MTDGINAGSGILGIGESLTPASKEDAGVHPRLRNGNRAMSDKKQPTQASRLQHAMVATLAALAAFLVLDLDATPEKTVLRVQPPPAMERPDPRLDRVLDTVDFNHVQFSEVLRSLSERSGLNIVPTWRDVDDTELYFPITINLHQVTVRTALDAVISAASEQSGAALDGHDAYCWKERDGIVDLDQVKKSEGDPVVRIYDLLPLLDEAARVDRLLNRTSNNVKNDEANTALFRDNCVDEIRQVLSRVDETSWKDNGGEIGAEAYSSGNLVVIQASAAQDQIESFLSSLLSPVDPSGTSATRSSR